MSDIRIVRAVRFFSFSFENGKLWIGWGAVLILIIAVIGVLKLVF